MLLSRKSVVLMPWILVDKENDKCFPFHDTSSWCSQEQNTITSKSCSKWATPETPREEKKKNFFIFMWIMAMLKMTCHPYCKFRKNSNSHFSTFHFLSTLQRTCPSDYSKASSYLQSPQSQQTSEGPGLHRTYQIIPQVPEGKEGERVGEREVFSINIYPSIEQTCTG